MNQVVILLKNTETNNKWIYKAVHISKQKGSDEKKIYQNRHKPWNSGI